MINFSVYINDGVYYIERFHEKDYKKELPPRYIKRFIYIFYNLQRNKRLGKLFIHLVDTQNTIIISEYDLLQMIKVLYTKQYNLSAGNWLIEYYQEVYKYAYYELSKILPY